MNQSKILITGVAGLLGSRLSDYIIENHSDVQIVGIDDLSGGYIENVNKKVLANEIAIGLALVGVGFPQVLDKELSSFCIECFFWLQNRGEVALLKCDPLDIFFSSFGFATCFRKVV